MARILSLTSDLLVRITAFLERDDILTLTINTWLPNAVWREIFFRELGFNPGFPENQPIVWSEMYRGAFTRDHIYTFRVGANYDLFPFNLQGRPFYVHSPIAIMTSMVVESVGDDVDQTIQALLNEPSRLDVIGVRGGLWRAGLRQCFCNCQRRECLGPAWSFDAWHINLLAYNEYRDGVWEYEDFGHFGTHSWESRRNFSVGFFDRNELNNPFNMEMLLEGIGGGGGPTRVVGGRSASVALVFDNMPPVEDRQGIRISYRILRAGPGGDVLAVRAFSEQIL